MKKTITALFLALTLVLGLTGCTAKKDNGSANNDNNGTAQNGMTDNGTNNGSTNNGNTNNGTMNGGTNSSDGTQNNGSTTNPANGSRSYNGSGSYALPGSNGPTSSDSYNDLMRGRSYEEMLRNGRVGDTDGILTDGENYTSQW